LALFTDEALMKQVKSGDHAAFNLLYERYAGKLYRYLYRMLGYNESRAEDMLQELFLKVIQHRQKFDETKKVSTWLYAIATNLCRNEYRNTAARQRLMQQFEPWENKAADTVDEKIHKKYIAAVITEMIQGLNEQEITIVTLRFQQSLSLREIANVMELPEGTVKSKLFYLLKKLALQLRTTSID